MNGPRSLRIARKLLIATLLVTHAWFLVAWRIFDVQSDLTAGALDAVMMAQLGLIAAWMALGPNHWLLPWPARVACLALWLELLRNMISADSYLSDSMLLPLLASAASLLAMSGVRITGHRVLLVGPRYPRQPLHFSLFALVVLIGVAALAIQAGLVMRSAVTVAGVLPSSIAAASLSLAHVATLATAVSAVMRAQSLWLSVPLGLALCMASGSIIPFLCVQDQDFVRFNGWTLVDGAVLFASLLIVRTAGFRLVSSGSKLAETTNVSLTG